MTQKYCLSCGARQEMPGFPHIAHGKSQVVWTDGVYSVRDVVDCYGPFAECPPPEFLDGWEWTMSLPEPSDDGHEQ